MSKTKAPASARPGDESVKRVLFADFAIVKFSTITDWIKKENVTSEGETNPVRCMEKLATQHYDVCVINLLLGGMGPFELIRQLRENSLNSDIKIIVVSRQVQKANIQNTIKAGANDFVAEPFENEELYHRILYHLSPKKTVDPERYEAKQLNEGANWDFINLLLETIEGLSKADRPQEHATFIHVLSRVAALTNSNRTSLIITDAETHSGVVLATSDDPEFYDFPISLQKYPEIQHVMNSGQFVLFDDISNNALTQRITQSVKTISIGSLLVFPIRFQGETVGVLTIRRPKTHDLPNLDVLRVLQAIANTLAAHSHVKALLRKIYRSSGFKAA